MNYLHWLFTLHDSIKYNHDPVHNTALPSCACPLLHRWHLEVLVPVGPLLLPPHHRHLAPKHLCCWGRCCAGWCSRRWPPGRSGHPPPAPSKRRTSTWSLGCQSPSPQHIWLWTGGHCSVPGDGCGEADGMASWGRWAVRGRGSHHHQWCRSPVEDTFSGNTRGCASAPLHHVPTQGNRWTHRWI